MKTCLLLALLGLVMTGCANTTRFDTGPLTAYAGEIDSADSERYYLVRIDARGITSEQLPAIALPLPGTATPLPLRGLTPAAVGRHLPRFVPPPQWPDTWKAEAQRHPAFEGSGYFIGFDAAGLATVSLCSHCAGGRQSPSLCTASGDPCHELPLTRSQLVALVGPPDRERKVIEVRY